MTQEPLNKLELLSPCKLNLFLHITGRRADGYHNLQTLFQLLNYGDTLAFHQREDTKITLTPALEGVDFEDNLIIKAAKLLINATQTKQPQFRAGVDIHLTKRLPMGGGLGGGSSNAATTLVALNALWQCRLTSLELQQLGLALGADVPVFVTAQTAWAEGAGEILQPIEMPQDWFLVVQPECHVSTQQIFSHKDLTRDSPPIKVAAFLEEGGRNDCQALVRKLYPAVDKALRWFENIGYPAQMTGTGSCVFARFASETEARQMQACLPIHMPNFVAKGVNKSPLLDLISA